MIIKNSLVTRLYIYKENYNIFMKMNHILNRLLLNKTARMLSITTFLLLMISPSLRAQVETENTATPDNGVILQETVNFAQGESDYTLGSGDQIRLNIFQVEEYSGDYPVLVDGTISLPLVGSLNVDGLTLKEASELVSKEYSTYLKRPIVTVGLVAPRPLKIAIAGEVDNSGSYEVPLEAGTPNFPTVTDMIEQAGGITTLADVRNIRVTRTIQGREIAYNADLWSLLERGQINQDISLRDGDTIFIPTVDELNTQELARLSEASFGIQSDEPIKVAVVGQIYQAGAHVVEPEQLGQGNNNNGQEQDSTPPTLSQAIQAAGGIKPLANVKEVEVRRRAWNGDEKIFEIDLWELIASGDISKDIILQDGDRIIIPQATGQVIEDSQIESTLVNEITVNVVGEVPSPGAQQVRPNTPLNQAILAAGGFDNQRADTGEVELVRLNPDGTVDKRKIEINLAQGIDEESNPILRHQDVVVVSRSGVTAAADGAGKVLGPVGGALGLIRLFFGF